MDTRPRGTVRSLLKSEHGGALEAEVGFEVLRDFADEALEGELADEQLGGLLVAADLAERDGAGALAAGLLHAAGGGRGLARRLGGELLAGRLATGGLASGLLGTGHFEERDLEEEDEEDYSGNRTATHQPLTYLDRCQDWTGLDYLSSSRALTRAKEDILLYVDWTTICHKDVVRIYVYNDQEPEPGNM